MRWARISIGGTSPMAWKYRGNRPQQKNARAAYRMPVFMVLFE
jgi:hypothetical protein